HAPLIDVRTSPERAQSAIPNSTHFELDRILAGEDPHIEPDAAAVIYCASGIRSAQAVDVLRKRGFPYVVSLRGGINSWLEQH
ncbi:rhodanese-like domain-containing protein, partial [Corynebacterium tuberculostearicum]